MSKKHEEPNKRSRDFMEGLFMALLAALVIRQLIVGAYTIPTGSMEDTLLIGDFLLVNKFTYGMRTPDWIGIPYTNIGVNLPWYRFPAIRDPEPYDIIIFRYPRDPSVDYIKRCIAKGGQTVEIINKEVFVDGKPFPKPPHMKFIESYIQPKDMPNSRTFMRLGSRDNYGPITLPEDAYWAMGDNRDNSLDSRYWGYVPHDNIIGHALVIYFSFDTRQPLSRFYKMIRFNRIGTIIR